MTERRATLNESNRKPRIKYDCIGLWLCMGYGKRGTFCYARDFSPRMAYLMWLEIS